MVVKTATCVPFEDSEVQHFFEKLHNVSTFFWVWDKKLGFLSKKFSQGFYNRISRFQRNKLRKTDFPFQKVFFLFGIIFLIEQFLCRFAIFLISCVKAAIYVRGEEKLRELTLKNCYSIKFGFWAEKTWPFSKTVKHDSQKCSLGIQRSIFKNFPETTIIVWKFLFFEREDRISCQKIYAGLPKAHFRCPEQHFENKYDRSKIFCLWLL